MNSPEVPRLEEIRILVGLVLVATGVAATILIHRATPEIKFCVLACGDKISCISRNFSVAHWIPVQVCEVAEGEGAHVVECLRHSVVRLGHHCPEWRE